METKTLELIFLNQKGKNFTLRFNDPKEDLTEKEVEEAMNQIVLKNIFNTTGGEIVAVQKSRIITKVVEDILEK